MTQYLGTEGQLPGFWIPKALLCTYDSYINFKKFHYLVFKSKLESCKLF